MPILDVTKVAAVGFTADGVNVTAPDGNIWIAQTGVWYGVPYNSREMEVSTTDPVLCMEAGSHLKRSSGEYVQVFTIDSVRTPVA